MRTKPTSYPDFNKILGYTRTVVTDMPKYITNRVSTVLNNVRLTHNTTRRHECN
jgi:hypothetical protein